MSVPRRLGAGHSDFDNGTGTCALQSRHPSGFDADKPMDGVNGHTYTNGLSSTSSTHIAANQLSTLTLNAAYATSPSAKSPHAFSIASTSSTPTTPSPSSSFSFTSPCPSSSTASPSHLPPLHATAPGPSTSGSGSMTVVSSFSSTSTVASTSPSPGNSPSPMARRPSMLKPSQSPSPSSNGSSASTLRFASPFRSHKQSSSPHIQNEAISQIMQEESPPSGGSPNGTGNFKSPGSPRALPSPKPSPGVRAQVASPAPTPSTSPSAVVAYNQLPAIDRLHRYVVTGTLQQSLFGVVKLAFDRVGRQLVAIKISRRERAQQQTTRSGVSVLENVRREAAVMQYLHDRSASGTNNRFPERRKSLYAEMLAHMTANSQDSKQLANGGSSGMGGKKVKRMSSRATTQQRMQGGGDERMNIDDDNATQQAVNGNSVGDSDSEASDSDARMSTPSSMLHRISVSTPSGYSTTTYEASPSHSSTFSSSSISSPSGYSSGFATPQTQSPPSSGTDPLDVEGEKYICRYVEELEDEYFHYLVTEFVPAGDLYSMLTSFPQHRLTENQARGLFRQMVLGVRYLHVRNVAHLDMSLENMWYVHTTQHTTHSYSSLSAVLAHFRMAAHPCWLSSLCCLLCLCSLDMEDSVRIIDFGVSALHPFTPTAYQTNYFSFPSASSPISFPSSINSPTNPAQSPTHSTTTSSSTNGTGTSDSFTPHPHRSFLCKPVKELYAKPGKIRYMSPELFQGLPWDAYANDVFSLGVILYSLLTGRPPFQQAEATDVWFHVIYSGQWLNPNIRKQSSAHVYTHLSEPALQLINFILKPQERRPTCEQILQQPWMQVQ